MDIIDMLFMDKKQLLFIYIDYIYDLKMLIIKKKKIPTELIGEIKELQLIIKNYDRLQRMILQFCKKRDRENLHSKDEYFKQFFKDYFEPVNHTEENKVR